MSTDIERARHAAKVMSDYADYCEKHGKPPKCEVRRRVAEVWCSEHYPHWDWAFSDYRIVPDPPLSVEVGQWYETRGGRPAVVLVRANDNGEVSFEGFVEDYQTESWTESGKWSFGEIENECDLIRRIDPPEWAKEWARTWLGGGVEVTTWIGPLASHVKLTPELREWMTKHGATFKE